MTLKNYYSSFFPFWQELSSEDKDFLCANSSKVYFDETQPVHNNGECSGLFIVQSGRLRLYMMQDGKEITLYRLSPGEICMFSACCVIQNISFDVFVEAEEFTECYKIEADAFFALMNKSSAVKIYAYENAISRFSDVMWAMQQTFFFTLNKRLAIFLFDEVSHSRENQVTITHEQLALHLGTSREVISRLLKKFASNNIIEQTRKSIIVKDRLQLKELAYS